MAILPIWARVTIYAWGSQCGLQCVARFCSPRSTDTTLVFLVSLIAAIVPVLTLRLYVKILNYILTTFTYIYGCRLLV